jgi:eukaryotic-like serine/threonine-protein kinase
MVGERLSHYRILEQIGAGGMGVVYRAHDEQLDRDVAIKVLPRGSLADDSARRQFRKEALSLARLNHPNIATVHEFGSQDGIDFLVTEFIAGITLDVKLANGSLPPAEVVRLGVQFAEGLAAAHQQGIVHRDLKPANLRLTPDGRLKILDFGLAQLMPHASELGLTATATQTQSTSGTLPYLSPEQLSGEVADARSDIWAAGAVLYEMSTGKRPFQQSVPALLINAILNQTPEPASKLNPAVPIALNDVILKALAHDRARRYESATELATDLGRPMAVTSTAIPVSTDRSSHSWIYGVAAAMLVTAIAGYFFVQRHPRTSSSTTTPASSSSVVNRRRSIAVLGFKNLSASAEKSWLSTAIAEMLTTELSQGDQLRAIPGESIAQMKMSLALPDADSFSQQTLTRIRQNLGSDDVVLGSYLPLPNGLLRLDVRLQDAVAGETLASVSEKGNESEIDSLVSKAGAELRVKLGVGALSDAQSATVRASLPSSPEAARLYSSGLQKLRLLDARVARECLEQAAALDPNHAPTHAALAEAWSLLGYESKAKDQAKRALELSAHSSREERLSIEGRAHEMLDEKPQAIDSYQALWEFFPDNIDYALLLIRAQVVAGHGSDAEKTLADLRKLTVSDVDAARIDVAEASIAASSSDFKREQALSNRAASRAGAAGASLLVARALQSEAHASEHLGQTQQAIDFSNQARVLFASAGDRRAAARSVLGVGDVLFDRGDYEGAKKQFAAALPVFLEIGALKSVRACRERIGNVFYSQGNMREARNYYEQVLSFDHEIDDPYGLGGDYGNLGNALEGLGDLPGALKAHQQSLEIYEKIGDRRGASTTQNNLGNLMVEVGSLEEAKKYYQQALATTREIAYRLGEPYPITGMGDALLAQGDLVGARGQYDQALALCKQVDDEDFAAQIEASLASIDLYEKKYAEGEALARQAVAGYEKANSTGEGAWAHAILARNLLAAGKLVEAQSTIAKAFALVRKSTGEPFHYEVSFADARAKAKSGKTSEALNELNTTLSSARKFGYRLYEYQARFSIGEIQLWAGSASAQSSLTTLEKDARDHGALLMANEARDLLAQTSAKAKTP